MPFAIIEDARMAIGHYELSKDHKSKCISVEVTSVFADYHNHVVEADILLEFEDGSKEKHFNCKYDFKTIGLKDLKGR